MSCLLFFGLTIENFRSGFDAILENKKTKERNNKEKGKKNGFRIIDFEKMILFYFTFTFNFHDSF